MIKVLDVLLALHENPNLTIPKLTELTSHSSSTIEKLLARLKGDEIITRKGSRKTGYWEIISNKKT